MESSNLNVFYLCLKKSLQVQEKDDEKKLNRKQMGRIVMKNSYEE